MKNSNGTAVWILGALLISVLLGAGVYALLISPQLDASSTAKSSLASVQDFNRDLDTRISAAEVAAKDVDGWYAEIAAIRVDMPPTPEQDAFERLVDASLKQQGLPTVSITYGTPTSVAPTATDVAGAVGTTPSPDTSASADPSAQPSAAPSAEPSAGPVAPADTAPATADVSPLSGLLETPVTITTEGNASAVMRFLLDMQTQNVRFFTVTNFDIERSEAADAQAGRPALLEGDWVVNITGLVFNLFDAESSLPLKEPVTTPRYAGGEVPNPFLPIPGTETVTGR